MYATTKNDWIQEIISASPMGYKKLAINTTESPKMHVEEAETLNVNYEHERTASFSYNNNKLLACAVRTEWVLQIASVLRPMQIA